MTRSPISTSAFDTTNRSRVGRRLMLCAAAVVAVGSLATTGSAGAATDDSARSVVAPVPEPDGDRTAADAISLDGDMVDILPIDSATANAEQDELAAYLTARGIAFRMVEDGEWRWVEIDRDDQAAVDAVDDFYWEKYPMPQEVIDQINADNEALADYLRGRGIDVTVTVDRHGLTLVEWDWEDPAAQIAVEDFYWEMYPMPQEVIDQINAEAQALVAFLQARGLEATVTTDRHGLQTAEFDWEDPAVQAALSEYDGFAVALPAEGLDILPVIEAR